MRRRRWGLAATACAFVVACLQGPVAAAAPGTESGENGADTARNRTCVASVTAESGPLPSGDSRIADFRCFRSLSSALSYATDGRLQLAPTARRVERTQLEAAGAISTAAARVLGPVLGMQYANQDFGGATLVLSAASGRGCIAGASYTFSDLSNYGFDNRISSAEMFSNCIARYHAGKNLNGDSRYCDTARCASLGAMNDRASSIKFF